MSNASRDENRVTTLLGTLNTDGETVVAVKADESNHGLLIDMGSTGSDLGGENAIRDANRVPVLLAVSADDGVTPVPVYADSDGKILIDNT